MNTVKCNKTDRTKQPDKFRCEICKKQATEKKYISFPVKNSFYMPFEKPIARNIKTVCPECNTKYSGNRPKKEIEPEPEIFGGYNE